ncbi:hypothetical protein HPB47_024678 [Ixodes persulcatus]|uniref:Uncharacterized protein n=1 Tax=Ixodes persulcatus TaxID=34615 RepID=A0AC60Q3X1_IXOPE|nr:hypothetical protein HPB47_024678 [Ixodes persulcatus]
MGNAARLRFLLLQIFAAAWAVEEVPHPLTTLTSNQRGFEERSQFPSSPTTSADFLPGATLVWQRTGTLSCDFTLQKEQPPTSQTGFGAGMGNAARLRFLLLQLAMTAEELTPSIVRMALENQLMPEACAGHAGSASPVVQTVDASGDGRLNFD